MNLEPRQGIFEDVAMQERVLRARARVQVAEAALKREQVLEALDVPTGERQHAESRAARVWPAGVPCGGIAGVSRTALVRAALIRTALIRAALKGNPC